MTRPSAAAPGPDGLPFALGAYLLWGFLPLYFRLLHGVPAPELVAWRVLFTLPLCLGIVVAQHRRAELRAVLANRAQRDRLGLSALLIAANWLIYVWAIANGHVLAASLGYYVNPLLNILLGTLVLGERLNAAQWRAVALAAVGIALLLGGAIDTLGVALSLAISFALYGLVRKLTPVGAVAGLTVETLMIYPFAALTAGWYAMQPAGAAVLAGPGTAALLAGCGAITALPLLLFAVAARKLDLTTLGFVQFLSPTIAFALGLLVFREPLDPLRASCFALIWAAIALFSHDMVRRRRHDHARGATRR